MTEILFLVPRPDQGELFLLLLGVGKSVVERGGRANSSHFWLPDSTALWQATGDPTWVSVLVVAVHVRFHKTAPTQRDIGGLQARASPLYFRSSEGTIFVHLPGENRT